MDIRIKQTDYEMLPEASKYLDERINHIEKTLGDRAALARCEVEVGRDAGRPRHGANVWFAEFTITYPGAPTLRATNRSESINGAIDDAKEEIERQIRSDKQLSRNIVKRTGAFAKRLLRME